MLFVDRCQVPIFNWSVPCFRSSFGLYLIPRVLCYPQVGGRTWEWGWFIACVESVKGVGDWEKGRGKWKGDWVKGEKGGLWERGKGRGVWSKGRRKGKREGDFCTCYASGYKGMLSPANILQIVVFIHGVVFFFAVLTISFGRSLHKCYKAFRFLSLPFAALSQYHWHHFTDYSQMSFILIGQSQLVMKN